jgi:hypothetical protein
MLDLFLQKYNGRIVYQNKILKLLIIKFVNGEEVSFKLNNNGKLNVVCNKLDLFNPKFEYNNDYNFLDKIKEYLN